MYNCFNLVGLTVLSLYEGDLLGEIDKIYFSKDLKKLEEFEIIGENDVKIILKSKDIYKIGKNAIVIKNNQMVSIKMEASNLILNPIGSKAYSINGEFLGVVKDVLVNEKFITQKILLENNEVLEVGNVASCGKSSIIFNNNKKLNVKKFSPIPSPKIYKTENVQIAKTLPATETAKPTKPINSDFLLGRKCSKDILNFNNEVLIKANTTVTKKNLKEIKKFGKLKELMLYCK